MRVAEAEMRRALAVMTVERGIDPRRFALMPFGGAGPLHAASMAAELGIGRVLCPRTCGVLSALGLAAAAPRRDEARTVMLSGADFTDERVKRELDALIERAVGELNPPTGNRRTGGQGHARYELRYEGQSFELSVEAEIGDLRAAFEDAHVARYGYRDEEAEVELVTIRVSALGAPPALTLDGATRETPERASTPVVFDGERVEAELWRGELPTGAHVRGPALCAMPESTLLVPPGWHGTVDEQGTVLLERVA